uniref:GNAT family N-acetyltransferase n=1 Tax=uncultured Nocardioides sp. TaxID=198441 RepID=UPI00260A9C67
QTVQTHPEARRRGLAQALLHHAGAHALGELGARRLVLVADPDHHALDLYLGAGFARTESQVSAEGLRTPARP